MKMKNSQTKQNKKANGLELNKYGARKVVGLQTALSSQQGCLLAGPK